jgi:hypothetical protein
MLLLETIEKKEPKQVQNNLFFIYLVLILVHCKLCKLNFQKDEMRKKLTIKMILDIRNHMIQRGCFIYQHFKVLIYMNNLCLGKSC